MLRTFSASLFRPSSWSAIISSTWSFVESIWLYIPIVCSLFQPQQILVFRCQVDKNPDTIYMHTFYFISNRLYHLLQLPGNYRAEMEHSIVKRFSQNEVSKDVGPRVVVAIVQDWGLEESEFELQSRYYVHFRINPVGKGMNPLILPAIVLLGRWFWH